MLPSDYFSIREDNLELNLRKAGVTTHWRWIIDRYLRGNASSRRANRRSGVHMRPYSQLMKYSAEGCRKCLK